MTDLPMMRLKAYATANADGTYSVDAEGLLIDVVTLAKIDRLPLQELIENITLIWNHISIEEIEKEAIKRRKALEH